MASQPLHDLTVSMTLQKGEDALKDRVITLKSSGSSVQIGRASKTERKQLIPSKDNMWISNPVISRYHAVLSAEEDALANTPLVFLEDAGSSHGTYVNNVDIKDQGKKKISTGDRVQFGSKVLRGSDEFDPPVYRVSIDKVLKSQTKRPSATGRSISVPEESDESEMDESDSDVGSTGSHSSTPHWGEEQAAKTSMFPGSMNNPYTVDDGPAQTPIIIDIASSMASRNASEEYEPSPGAPIVPVTYTKLEIEVEEQEIEDEDAVYNERDFEHGDETTNSPVYIPTSPAYEEFVPEHQVQLPPMEEVPNLPLLQPLATPFNDYRDGPFAQPPEAYSGVVSTHDLKHPSPSSEMAEFDQTFGISDSSRGQEHLHYLPQIFPLPTAQTPRAATSVTISTQDLLHNARETSGKNDMSINSIINPTTIAGTKRKADEISCDVQLVAPPLEDGEVLDVDLAAARGVSRAGKNDALIEVVEVTEPTALVTSEKRPTKRLRASVVSHIGAFAVGGVAVLAGLMSLPDNYFG